jgi:hypothetical protein
MNLVGGESNTIINCYSTGSVTATGDHAGGLTSYCGRYGFISGSYHITGAVSSTSGMSGGLVGTNWGRIIGSYATSAVNHPQTAGDASNAGGFVANNYGEIRNCYATGTVTGSSTNAVRNWVGGFCGENNASGIFGQIYDCYSTGAVVLASTEAQGAAGGFVAYNYGGITDCFSTGAYTCTIDAARKGGFCGVNDGGLGVINTSFWNTTTSGTEDGIGTDGLTNDATGKTTTQMQTESTFTVAGWDFTNIWKFVTGNYPQLHLRKKLIMTD